MARVIFTPQGAIAGQIEGNVFITTRDPEKHLMKIHRGYGISVEVLNQLKELNVYLIRIREKGTSKSYKFKLSQYLVSKREYNFNGDSQRFVPLPIEISRRNQLGNYFEVKV